MKKLILLKALIFAMFCFFSKAVISQSLNEPVKKRKITRNGASKGPSEDCGVELENLRIAVNNDCIGSFYPKICARLPNCSENTQDGEFCHWPQELPKLYLSYEFSYEKDDEIIIFSSGVVGPIKKFVKCLIEPGIGCAEEYIVRAPGFEGPCNLGIDRAFYKFKLVKMENDGYSLYPIQNYSGPEEVFSSLHFIETSSIPPIPPIYAGIIKIFCISCSSGDAPITDSYNAPINISKNGNLDIVLNKRNSTTSANSYLKTIELNNEMAKFHQLKNFNSSKFETFSKLDSRTSSRSILVYPNPTVNNKFNIQFLEPMDNEFTLKIFNHLGELIESKRYHSDEIFKNKIIPVQISKRIPNGLLFIQIQNNHKLISTSIILMD